MRTISMRTLSRETRRVLNDVAASSAAFVITKNGAPVARLTPLSAFERESYAQLIAQGVDPFNPPQSDPAWEPLPPVSPGEKTVTDYLMEDRRSYDETG